ncbi:hypothetical protein GUJ93_ZPchr0755g29160 [Zizania palustris]|uniref:Nascent polypeptide-associated complex subunit beta n=1 Tax=Zizania palustris TaxID=103762 RepID=A0A8J5VUJ2_ZIZPA|nr:hypothetical protein GUJ93_ZPchr0755g29160 [Zizania palustris]
MGLVRKSENLIILAPLKKTYSTRTCACAAAAVCSIVLPGLPRLRLRRASANMNKERLMKMAGAVRTGGKGTMRRKKKAVHKTATTDDKRLQSTLKRVGVNTIPAIEEVNIFKDDLVIQFVNPKVQASIAATHGWSVAPHRPRSFKMFCLGSLTNWVLITWNTLRGSQKRCRSR